MTIDLKSQADDLTSIGLPGYFGIRVDCAIADASALQLAVNPNYEPLTLPQSGVPAQGATTTSTPSDPTRVYCMCVWVDGNDGPPNGDGQPNWPNSAVKSNPAVSNAVIGVVDGLPVDGY